jgi:hypothetical protein
MDKRFVILGQGKSVYLVWGGGKFAWWTPHKSMASKLTEVQARALVTQRGGTAYEIVQR